MNAPAATLDQSRATPPTAPTTALPSQLRPRTPTRPRLDRIRELIAAGHYDQPETIARVIETLARDLDLDRDL